MDASFDPNVTLELIRTAILHGNEGEACCAFRDLDTWLMGGGALPTEWAPVDRPAAATQVVGLIGQAIRDVKAAIDYFEKGDAR